MRPLTHAQLGVPELTARLREIIPENQQPHVADLACKAAQYIPAHAALLRAYGRTSVNEALRRPDPDHGISG